MSFFDRFRHKKPKRIYYRINDNLYRRDDNMMIKSTRLIGLDTVEDIKRGKAQEPLANCEDEAYSQEIAALVKVQNGLTGAQYDHYEQQLTAIGVKLSANGDHDYILQIALRAEYVAGLGQGPWILRLLDMAPDNYNMVRYIDR